MTHPKHSNSSFRYLIAGLKPLASVKVWGSVGIMALVAMVLWQYSLHPEWLGNDQGTASSIDGEFEGEVGNNVDIGVTIQDLEENRLDSSSIPVAPPELQNNPLDQLTPDTNQSNPFLSPSVDGNNPEMKQKQAPSIKFEPLMPSVKNLGSLFPPLQPSKNRSKPIEIPDDLENVEISPENPALENALQEVFSQDLPKVNPSNISPKNNQQPSPNRNRPAQPNYQTSPASGRNNPYFNQPQTQPNNSYPYTSPQPYSQPYGNGSAPAPVPAYPPSVQSPNTYPTVNSNPNFPNTPNQNQPTENYGIQPPQVDQYGNVTN